MDFPKKKIDTYQLSPSSLTPRSYFPMKASSSTERILNEVQQMKKLQRSDPLVSKNQNSLKYLKLAPIQPFNDSQEISSQINSKSRRNYKLQGIHPINITKNCVSRCAYISQKGSENKIPHDNNQDSILFQTKLNSQAYQFLFGVFDGHGSYGHLVSNFIKKTINLSIPRCLPEAQENDMINFLCQSIDQAINDLNTSNIDINISGSTLCLIMISGPQIVCASIGDSRCIIGKFIETWDYEILSIEHKPTVYDEVQRIEQAGGLVSVAPNIRNKTQGMLRVWSDDSDIPGLAMTRSIGDKLMKNIGVIDKCDITKHKITNEDKFAILATDGVWDVLSNEDAVRIVAKYWKEGKSELACKGLADAATKKWEECGVRVDDISLVVVFLHAKDY
ncbi:hypothetical protein SteCoe_34410 [Stentor coeruleus]|uniref:PPM-type phosphatase domain-containing protein n=1 Tax=Stentor coeruleus TaxID=5963 RepID=A0A1R2AUL5_9CILI|nr:hypothetical protein SteCoe_34410 [Stentor coeruleus]